MEGKFYIKPCDKIKYEIEYSLHNDSTLMSLDYFGNYELLLGNGYHIGIGVDKEEGKCLSVYCLLDALSFEKKNIGFCVENTKQYDLMYVSANSYEGSGEHYVPFVRRCYYDVEKSILAFGNIYDEGKIISFSSNSFAKLKDEELLAVFIKVSDNVISYLKKRK